MSLGFKFRKFIYEARLSLDTIAFHIIGCIALIYFVGDMDNGYIYMDADGTVNGWLGYVRPIILANLTSSAIYVLSRTIFPDYREDNDDFSEVVWSVILGIVSCIVASNVINIMDNNGSDDVSIAIALGHVIMSWILLYGISSTIKSWYEYKRDKEKFSG